MVKGLFMHTIITARDISFELSNGNILFKHLNFSLEPRLSALIGPNGIGKTSLAQLLSGKLEPTRGTVNRSFPVSFFPQREAMPAMSVEEFLASLQYTWNVWAERFLQGINRSELCTQLSGGEWMRVRLAVTITDQFLILDEPTNDLDRTGRDIFIEFLKECHHGALLISHDRECLQLCENIFELSQQGLSKFGGGWDFYQEMRKHERHHLMDDLDKAKRHRDKTLSDRIAKKAKQEKRDRQGAAAAARGGMPKILLGGRKRQAQVTSGQIDVETYEKAIHAVQEAHEALEKIKIDPVMYADLLSYVIPTQKLVAEAYNFNIRFEDWLYPEDLNFQWRGPVRVALKGVNGSGKSTLLKAIRGQNFQTRGILRSGTLNTLYLDQHCAILNEFQTVFENIRDVSRLDESEIRNGLAKFLFLKDRVFQPVHSLSGGERLRAALAKSFLGTQRPELLILDEPTNNLDLVNIEFLENLVRQFRGALVIISHDEVFLKNCEVIEELALP